MSKSKVDQRYRIVVDKQIREKTHVKAGDVVVLEPLNDHSFRVTVINFSAEKLEDDPAWKAIHSPIKAEKYIPPKRLEKILEDEVWRE
ncbi:MAG TPA: AbrB/MazE/SpoVT family DNA-binding domain-containing protein [Candidatus Bathyarchaeia archaeon]|nr:AbrB/MazE/SpoVT family DNA-binding domain-containing protein [Candidatus Bathyarchaeia archaeon]